jgi:hypothetical protein
MMMMMAANFLEELFFDGDIFIYRGGIVPEHLRQRITHVRIDKSVKIIEMCAFLNCINLLDVETHDGIIRIGKNAFNHCCSLKRIKLPGVREVEQYAFLFCFDLAEVEFGVELERIGRYAFDSCRHLRRIAIPLRENMFPVGDSLNTPFNECHNLATVDIVGGIHKTVSSLHLKSWGDEMKEGINRINSVLPDMESWRKTSEINMLIVTVIRRMEHYKFYHNTLLKEAMTLLELALWKAKLDEDKIEEDPLDRKVKKVKIDVDSVRRERRVTSGASIIIKNVLPFLQLA